MDSTEKPRAEAERRANSDEIKTTAPEGWKSAGIIPCTPLGMWFGRERHAKSGSPRIVDFGGKREGNETPWETAVRECKEESGIDLSNAVLEHEPSYHPKGKHVLFFVKTDQKPVEGTHHNMLKYVHLPIWPSQGLHPRLQYDYDKKIREARMAAGFY